MVAATFPNLSFEDPPGTGPTLLSGNPEPYALNDGDILEVTIAGISESVVFLTTDFQDISAATADEVAALLALRVEDLGATNDGGFVRLTSLITGEDVTLEVEASSTANLALGFAAGSVTGETFAGGPPNGWTVTTDTDSVNERASFADENSRPEEIFDGNDSWAIVTISDTFGQALFDLLFTPTPFETFTNWATTGFLTTFVAEAASFDTINVTFEDFEDEWGLPTYFEFLPVNLITGINPEDFESGWGTFFFGTWTFPIDAALEQAEWRGGIDTFEDFENVSPHAFVAEVTSSTAGFYTVFISGRPYTYEANGVVLPSVIASNLASAIDGGEPRVFASSSGSEIFIGPDPNDAFQAFPFVVTATGPGISVNETRDLPAYNTEWVAQDRNPDF